MASTTARRVLASLVFRIVSLRTLCQLGVFSFSRSSCLEGVRNNPTHLAVRQMLASAGATNVF